MIDDLLCNGYWNLSQSLNFYLFFVISFEYIIMGSAMIWWVWRLRRTYIRWFIVSFVPLNFIWASWALGNMFDMYYKCGDPPLATLYQRIAMFFAIMLQIVFIAVEAKRAHTKEKSLILIVEDNETLAKIYRNLLDRAEYNADICTSGYDALTIMSYTMPDLIITDIRLGDMSGDELINKMRDGGFAGKVIAVSGTFANEKHTFDEFLLKPVTRDELLSAVRKHLA